jgi:hypothetical protein
MTRSRIDLPLYQSRDDDPEFKDVQAVLMINYYTFVGPIINLDDNSGLLALAGLSTKDTIRYTFLINRGMEGTRIKNGGDTHTYDNDRLKVYFYTDLIKGSSIHKLNRYNSHKDDSVITYNRGFESNRRFDLLSGSNKHYVNIWGISINNSPDGTALHGLECVYDKNKKRSVISSKLSLISISDQYAIPPHNETAENAYVGQIHQLFQL